MLFEQHIYAVVAINFPQIIEITSVPVIMPWEAKTHKIKTDHFMISKMILDFGLILSIHIEGHNIYNTTKIYKYFVYTLNKICYSA